MAELVGNEASGDRRAWGQAVSPLQQKWLAPSRTSILAFLSLPRENGCPEWLLRWRPRMAATVPGRQPNWQWLAGWLACWSQPEEEGERMGFKG